MIATLFILFACFCFCIADNPDCSDCCIGDSNSQACYQIGLNDGDAAIGNGSCDGIQSCAYVAQCVSGKSCEGIVGINSCEGYWACRAVGKGTNTQDGKAVIGDEACIGREACVRAGERANATIGDRSCIGNLACWAAGSLHGSYNGNSPANFYVGENSCRGDEACEDAARIVDTKNNADIFNHTTTVEIGKNSCNDEKACFRLGSNRDNPAGAVDHNIKIGSGSCNCVRCCRCLTGSVTVGDGQCNTRGEDANECCKDDGSYDGAWNTNFVSNSGGNGVVGDNEYILPVYNVSSPECTIDNSGAAAIVNITCNYTVTVPTTSRGSGNISSSIHGFTQCNETDKDFGAAEGISIASSDLTEGDDDNYQVVIQVTPNDTDTTANIKFCLHTEVKDNEENVMKFQSQVIGISVNYNTTFAVNVTSTEFEGFNATADDLGTVKFDVEAYRCDENKNNYTVPAALTINDPLYVCIKTKSNDIVVDEITRFNLKKESGGIGYNILGAGIDDFNTFVKDPDSSHVQVGTRPRATLFEDDTKIIIEGSAVLGSATSDARYFAQFILIPSLPNLDNYSIIIDG